MRRRTGKQKLQYKASRAPTKKTEPIAVGKKRKHCESSGDINNINFNISLGKDFEGLLGGVNPSDSQSPAKKAKTGPSKPTERKTEEFGSSKPSKKATELGFKEPLSQARKHDLPYPSNTNIGAAEEISLAGQKPILARAKRKLKAKGTTQTGKEVGLGKELNARKEARVKKELGAKPLSNIKHGLDAD